MNTRKRIGYVLRAATLLLALVLTIAVIVLAFIYIR